MVGTNIQNIQPYMVNYPLKLRFMLMEWILILFISFRVRNNKNHKTEKGKRGQVTNLTDYIIFCDNIIPKIVILFIFLIKI